LRESFVDVYGVDGAGVRFRRESVEEKRAVIREPRNVSSDSLAEDV
jgi:hypothetical protein